ncbi:hypothetical protein COS31_02075 [Candidatus Roizmanbacteria bacterium CG02_land_8_20_14_3_00_36_15]|uniref:Fimbrial assembly protein n=2 Tax=Candidatus Roizmaniibacteriota TaxID=1752723 RepID=A0A2M8KLY8_9BACT|nr:MAG: hypothetical protein COS51_03280 [Candidatus Roizmanbacteria bacterium CG03_land_8_20_14_0_80_36_21]PIV37852.1 MAG: hypothetical protein COS31_02075 [Candidatus Roizmanbacteria bacterium CG02_land_8_20_14_3_00_36_15]PIY70189.1 MAG: hypothetical protein COY89_02495 [Candidatus Roizmanbacteria bacterium CG_4_10_14_0_8_um_filter_36_36]PJA53418.1 MAG: hypothetical protein CO166_01940 [Candidatus Roizmanbacteria bacterium CG_4_9_14_3_um_filter_36_11]PJC81345.1 MAG: hypothetical protein CO007
MKYKINLMIEKKESLLDQIIYFSLNYLRYIIVITQIVVIFVFYYKFKVDQEIIDLKEGVDQRKEIIQVSQPLLKEAEAVESKINQIKPILKEQNSLLSQFNYVLSIFPEPIFLIKLRLDKDNLFLDGYSEDASAIKQFYYQLKNDKKFKKASLNNIKRVGLKYEFNLVLSQYND